MRGCAAARSSSSLLVRHRARAIVKTPPAFLGRWRMLSSALWELDDLDAFTSSHITFGRSGRGVLEFIAVNGDLDCRFTQRTVEWSWVGDDDGHPVNGRGRAELGDDGVLRGRIFFHDGDDSAFEARRDDPPRGRAPHRR